MERIAHYFYPHEANNYKARLLHSPNVLLISFLLILYQVLIQTLTFTAPSILGYAANISPPEVIRLTNEKRIANGLSPLVENPVLSQAALAKGTDMIEKDYWAHIAPDGTQPWKFFADFGYRYRFAGENLARDFAEETPAVEAWMASPSHRENMLSASYNEIGVAVVEGDMAGVDTTIIVQFFGARYAGVAQVPVAEAGEVKKGIETEPAKTASPSPPSPSPSPQSFLAEASEPPLASSALVSPFASTRNASLIVVGTLFAVLVVDARVTKRKGIARISGRALAHLSFLGMIIAIVIIARAGSIL